ncbi:PQQ-binding-like beta-propeller repeat protein [Maribacter halichondriae]|uniref:PQQ-binding-like beta-propeller repeat protein n=1 Tax=Maribacter halichondriae TaxID=2980554 RepID=UPI00235A3B17|nr:PQQ-binding-like beta-propeller repeat protein [Maribacter sp. Hal144]
MTKILIPLFLVTLNLNVSYAQDDVLWKFQTNDKIYSSPIIDGDILFIGSGDNSLYAIDKNTGKKVWTFETGGAIHSTPLMLDNLIYFGSADGSLYALDKNNGNLVWKFDSEGEKMYDIWDYYLSSPSGEEETIYWGSGDGYLYAINSKIGQLNWKFQTNGIVHATPIIYNNNIYVGSFDGVFYCVNKENGTLVWKFKTVGSTYFPKGEIQKAALVKDEVVYFGSRDYNIYALDAKTGTGRWNMKQPRGWIIATPIEYKDNLYFGTSDAHIFYSMKKVDGIVNWTIPVNMRVYGTALAYNDNIYFGTFDGKVKGIDYLTGHKNWEFQTEQSKLNYYNVFNKEGEFKEGFELYGRDFRKSEELILSLGSILSSPVIDNGIIYFGSSDGIVYAITL